MPWRVTASQSPSVSAACCNSTAVSTSPTCAPRHCFKENFSGNYCHSGCMSPAPKKKNWASTAHRIAHVLLKCSKSWLEAHISSCTIGAPDHLKHVITRFCRHLFGKSGTHKRTAGTHTDSVCCLRTLVKAHVLDLHGPLHTLQRCVCAPQAAHCLQATARCLFGVMISDIQQREPHRTALRNTAAHCIIRAVQPACRAASFVP